MIRDALVLYLINGLPVSKIAGLMSTDRATIRAQLKSGGIILRPTANGYQFGRDPVCGAVRRAGYGSFHSFAQVRSMDPITEQATTLGVSEKSLTRVYNSYRRLMAWLDSSGVVLPTSQLDGAILERTGEHP